jgi:hypothetical protein
MQERSNMRAGRIILAIAAIGLVALGLYVFFPRQTHFRDFDAATVASAETEMWRAYYEHREVDLALGLALNAHNAFGLSPFMSARIGYAAARAAQAFQPSHSRAEAQAAIPMLTEYFRLLSRAVKADVDPAEAARLELEWWQQRRETDDAGYEPAVGAATAYLYSVPPDELARYAELRTAAMDLRDRKGRDITETDWIEIKRLLTDAYTALREAVQPPSRASAA